MEESTIRDGEVFSLETWPSDLPFPLSDAECAALCRGHLVKWPGTVEDLYDLPGRYEMLDGWLLLKR